MNLQPTRRQVLASSLMLPAACASPGLLRGVPRTSDRTLVLVQLRGGNDGLNTVVPRGDRRYHDARPDIALPESSLLALNDEFGLHPSLARTARRFAAGQVCVVQGVGYPGPNLSHFRSMDVWDAASVDEPLPAQGWMGRECDAALGEEPSPLAMLAFGRDVLPHAMRAERALACAVPSLGRYQIRTAPRASGMTEARARRAAIEALNPLTGDPRLARLADAARAARASIDALARVARAEAGAEYPDTKLGRGLALAARVIVAGLPTRFVYVSQDGYDTHAVQARTQRALLSELDAALDAFLTDLAVNEAEQRALVMTISDFGRRVAQNGLGDTAGTDHGAASVQFLLGARARGGVLGTAPDLDDLDGDGNLKHTVDFRRVYAGVVADWLGGDPVAALDGTFEKMEVVS